MYEMVTGRRPFGGDSDFQIMSAHLQQAPMAPIEVIPGIPAGLSDIILMAIEKDPAARFQTAEAFRAALGHAFPEAASPTKTLRPMPILMPTATMPPSLPQNLPPTAPIMAAGAAAPWVAPAAAPRSRRGLYMALGSIVTLAILIAAVIEGPKLMRGGKSDAQAVTASQPAAAAVAPEAAPVAQASPEAGAGSAPVATVAPESVRVPEQVLRPVPRAASSAKNLAPPQQVAQAAPVQQVQQGQAAPPQAAQPVTAATASPELKELRDKINRVAVRAAAAQAGVRSIEQGPERKDWGCVGILKRRRFGLIMCCWKRGTRCRTAMWRARATICNMPRARCRRLRSFWGNSPRQTALPL